MRAHWPLILGGTVAAGLSFFGACAGGDEVPVPLPALPLDERLPAEGVRAGQVTRGSELLTGDTAKGRVGDFKIYNGKIAVIIAAAGESRGYNPYGGNILDADIIRAEGQPGRSSFGEVINALDLSVPRVDKVEVIADGRDGKEARIRVSGAPDKFPLFEAILSTLFPPRMLDMDWTVDYVLTPGSSVLRLETEVFNKSVDAVDFGLPIVAFFFGDGAQPFLEGYGFAPRSSGPKATTTALPPST